MINISILILLFSMGSPPDLLSILSWISGIFLSLSICTQVSREIRDSWIEKNCAVSHRDYLASIECTSLKLSTMAILCLGIPLSLLYLILDPENTTYLNILMISVNAIIPSFLVPYLIFQIDPKENYIQVLLISFVSFIFISALLIHWGFLAIAPIIRDYGYKSQNNRFYRA